MFRGKNGARNLCALGTTLTESDVARNDLLRAVIYPDSDDTTALGNGIDGVSPSPKRCDQ